MKKLLPLLLLVGFAAYAQPSPSTCGGGGTCKASSFSASKTTLNSITLHGDAGILFGDGTIQNTAASGFSGTATSFTATAAANNMAFQSNQGAEWCFDATCNDRIQADGGYTGQNFNAGMYGLSTVKDQSGNYGWVFGTQGPTAGAISNARLFSVRNGNTEAFYVDASGGVNMAGGVSVGYMQTNDYYPNGNKFVRVRGSDPDNLSTSIAVKIGNSSSMTTAGAAILDLYNDAFSTLKFSLEGDGKYYATKTNTGFNMGTTDGAHAQYENPSGTGQTYELFTFGGTTQEGIRGDYAGMLTFGTNGGGFDWHGDLNAATPWMRLKGAHLMIGTQTDDGSGALLQVAGAETLTSTVSTTGLICSGATHCGTKTLSTGTGTVTVVSGCHPVCTDTTAANAVACSVSSTTLTVTGTGSDVIDYFCF